MTEEKKEPTVSEILRITAGNTIGLMGRIADHIDELEAQVAQLKARIVHLEGIQSDSESQ